MAPTVQPAARLVYSTGTLRKTARRVGPRLKAHRLKDVAGKLQERHGDLSGKQSREIVQDVFNIVQDALANGDEVVFDGAYREEAWMTI